MSRFRAKRKTEQPSNNITVNKLKSLKGLTLDRAALLKNCLETSKPKLEASDSYKYDYYYLLAQLNKIVLHLEGKMEA